MQKITRWSPDTCGCKVDIEWEWITIDDNGTPKSVPNILEHRLITPCGCHQSHTGTDILLENQTKNKAIQAVAEASPAELGKLNDNGSVSPNLDKLSYSFDKDRNLTIISTDKTVDMVKIQAELDSKLGAGKVSIG